MTNTVCRIYGHAWRIIWTWTGPRYRCGRCGTPR